MRHTGLGDSSQLHHPRAAHNLLEYQPDCVSFITRSPSLSWIGGQLPTWLVRYKLFKQYNILNKEVQAEDEKRAGVVATTQLQVLNPGNLETVVEGGRHKRQKKSRVSKPARINPLVVTVAGGSSPSAREENPSGLASAHVTIATDVPNAIPVPTRSRGVAVPLTGLEDDNVYKEGEDPEIEAYFDETYDLLHPTEENVLQRSTEQQGFFFDYSSSSTEIIFSRDFPFLPTDAMRRLIREHRVRVEAKPSSSSSDTGMESNLPRSPPPKAAGPDTSKGAKRKTLQQMLLEREDKAISQADLAKASKSSSRKKMKGILRESWGPTEFRRRLFLRQLKTPQLPKSFL